MGGHGKYDATITQLGEIENKFDRIAIQLYNTADE
jgi:chitinase